jgi:N-acetyl-gamma-glutamyl-phosphate reductase
MRHPRIDLVLVTSRQLAGRPLSSMAAWAGDCLLAYEDIAPTDLAGRADVFFLALPHGVAASYAVPLREAGAVVLDLSADFRLKNPSDYREFYGAEHPAPNLLDEAIYGLPELHRAELAKANLIACPGCHPTAAILAIAPALKSGLADGARLTVNSLTGISGAGKKSDVFYSFCERSESIAPYAVTGHRHIPEIYQELRPLAKRTPRFSFVPHLIPVRRGMLTTATAPLARAVSQDEASAAYNRFYENEPLSRMLPENILPDTQRVALTHYCEIAVRVDLRGGCIIMMSAIDNLGKGAAGQAIQAFNIRFGFAETEGLGG